MAPNYDQKAADVATSVASQIGSAGPDAAPLVHVEFEHHVSADPSRIVISDIRRRIELTYEDLNERANRIASSILASVGSAGGRVAIVVEDDIDAIVGLIGTWKAGKTAVPLDTSNPRRRLEQLMAHADVEAFIGGDTTLAPDAVHLAIDHLATDVQNPDTTVQDGTMARIMYTSGSTGLPKGVTQSHRFLIAKVASDREVNGYNATDRLSQMLPLGFAASTSHTLGALTNGARLCMYDPNASGLHNLEAWISAEKITRLQLAPGLFRRFAEQLDPAVTFPTVRYVLVGGDRVLHHDIELFQRHFAARSVFINRFAATECGPISRLVIGRDDPVPPGIVPLGTPLPGRGLSIIDEDDNEVPAGQTGRIVVIAHDLSDGYWRDDALTQSSFGTTPEGAAFFRTGDLGRINADGNLEHGGRSNERIKVRGYGVDLIEVEKSLLGHPGVREIAMVVSERTDGESTIVAYVVPTSDADVEERTLRTYLTSRLPSYSVPAGFVILDTLPLTSRGKVNRSELPAWNPDAQRAVGIAPTTELETDLVAMFESTLGVSNIGTDDSFWDLGGTSIQALTLFAVISERYGRDLAPTALLVAPDVASLSALIESGGARDTNRVVIPIRSGGSTTPLICIHGGGGGIFFARDIAQYIPDDRPIIAVQAEGFEGAPPPYRTVEELADRYVSQIREAQPRGPYQICGLSFGGLVAIEIARHLVAHGDTLEFLGLIDTKYPGTKDDDLDDGVGKHSARMADLSSWKKLQYVAEGVWKRLVRRPYRRRRVRRYVREGRPIPVKGGLRNSYFFSLHARASRSYAPGPISVPIALLSEAGATEAQRHAWEPSAAAGLTITEASAEHHDLVKEPAVQEVARWIRDHTDA